MAAKEQAALKAQAAAKAKLEAEAKAQAVMAAKAKAEEEARAKAAIAAQVKAKAEEEAKAKAAIATQEKARAEAEAAAKAEAQAKADAKKVADTQTIASATVSISPVALNKMVGDFETAYQAGDLDKLMDLYALNVRTNNQTNLAGVRGEYQSLFVGSTERSIKFSNLNWEREENYARGTGQYAVSVLRKGERAASEETGKITLQLENRSGKLQITRFYSSEPVITPVAVAVEANKVSTNSNPFSRIPVKELNSLLSELKSSYAAGDIEAFMHLFAKDAQTNDRATVEGIREDYVGLFKNTSFREIAFKQMNWTWNGSIAHGAGIYNVDVQANGQTQRDHYKGQVWIQMERREGGVRITHFAFSE